MSDSPHPPSFSIVNPQDFLSEQLDDSVTHTLPTNFIVSLSYKPLNNTVLSLFSLLSYPHNHVRSQEEAQSSNITTPELATFQSELMLGQSATLVQSDSYYDLWRNFSMTATLRYTLNLIVMNGKVGMCLDGDYHPPMETVQLWSNLKTTDSLEMRFSPYLKSVSSLVRPCIHSVLCNYNHPYVGDHLQHENHTPSGRPAIVTVPLFCSLPCLPGR